ncbi:MAG: PAS domain S-box protein [Verrucomicrobia bacterium]|nr:MAG: PAS domain S-box protein [Verrucomicrobiota bacterium]
MLLTVTRDLIERKGAEEALRDERARLKATLDVALDCIVTIDGAGCVLDWNPAAEQTFGWSRAEVLGLEMAELIVPPDLRERHRQGMARAALGEMRMLGQRIELRALHRDGHTFPVELSISRVETGGDPIFTGFIRDITQRKEAEAEILALNADLERRVEVATAGLRQQAEKIYEANLALTRFKAVADITSDFVCITNLQAEMLYINPAGRALLGHALDADLVGMSFTTFASDDFIRRAYEYGFKRAMETGAWQEDVMFKRCDGSEFPVSMVGIGIKAEDGTPMYFSGVCRDISERVAMEAQLRGSLNVERDLNMLKTNFVNMISHEFRTPLGVIMSSTEILTKYFDRLPEALRNEHLNDVVEATRRMGVMMEEILLLARVDAGSEFCKPEPMELVAFCRQLAADVDLASSQKCPIVVCSTIAPQDAHADSTILRHIFTNLMNNAVKFSPTGSPVKLEIQRYGDDAVFVVSDQGIGIPQKDMSQIFNAFHRGSNTSEISGTGLGLVIVKRCVTLHGGSVELSSELGQGTTFTVRLPLFAEFGEVNLKVRTTNG